MLGFVSKKTLNALLEEKEQEKQNLKKKIEEKSELILQYEENISQKNAQIENLCNENVQLKNNSAKLNVNIENLQKKNADLEDLQKNIYSSNEVITKLKKQLKNAEEELEEAEEENSDIEKKYQQKKEENKKLNETLFANEKQIKEFQEKLEIKEKEIGEQEKTILLKEEALEFMTEILTAKEAPSNQNDYAKIDSVVEYILDDYKDCVKECFEMRKEEEDFFFDTGLLHWAAIEKRKWLKGKKTIAFVGEFSAGKTSIVNKILEQGKTNISLPVSTKATTAIPTYISHSISKNATYQFFTPDNTLKNLKKDAFEKVDKSILAQLEGVTNLIKYFVMSVENDNLKDLSILDTPGFSSNDKDDAIRTIEVINECDALFWVFDVNVGSINKSSLKVIKENLQKPLYVIINKIDTKTGNEVAEVENFIKKEFKKENIALKGIIKFSNKKSPNEILSTIKKITKTNDASNFICDFKSFIKEKEKHLKADYEEAKKELFKNKNCAENANDEINHAFYFVEKICGNVIALIEDSYKKRFLKEQYEISLEDYEEIKEQMGDLNPNNYESSMNKLGKAIKNYADAIQTVTKGEENFKDLKAQKKRFEECEKQLEKRLKALK